MPLEEKVALITGASRGLGAAILSELAQVGATVIGTATSQSGADKISNNIKELGAQGEGLVVDVNNHDLVKQVLAQINEQYAAPCILINNAGITRDNLILRMKDDEWNDVIDTNLNSIFHITKACLKPMLKNRWGRIINMSSVVGCTGGAGQSNYATAKAGMIGFSKSLAQELASRNITVNVIAPGYIETDMTSALPEERRQAILSMIPMARIGKPEDIANAVSFLVSDKADYITGQTLHVNGGMYCS